jgi:hypothetical protein
MWQVLGSIYFRGFFQYFLAMLGALNAFSTYFPFQELFVPAVILCLKQMLLVDEDHEETQIRKC